MMARLCYIPDMISLAAGKLKRCWIAHIWWYEAEKGHPVYTIGDIIQQLNDGN